MIFFLIIPLTNPREYSNTLIWTEVGLRKFKPFHYVQL